MTFATHTTKEHTVRTFIATIRKSLETALVAAAYAQANATEILA